MIMIMRFCVRRGGHPVPAKVSKAIEPGARGEDASLAAVIGKISRWAGFDV